MLSLRRIPSALSALFACAFFLGSCEGAKIGAKCSSNGDCQSNLCMAEKCTSLCQSMTECPLGFDCGQASPGDLQATCYARTYDQTSVESGGFGADCSLASKDSKGAQCDPNATDPCAAGFYCLAKVKCDINAYCTKACGLDTDCPPSYYCGTLRGPACDSDEDCPAQRPTCSEEKLCIGKSCIQRSYCIPCMIDEQCGTGSVCAALPSGERYCANVCTDQANCPHPPRNFDTTRSVGRPFALCTPDTTTRATAVSVCAPRSGFCHGGSAAAGVEGENTVCSWCRPGFPEDCGDGLGCFVDDATGERLCTQNCTVNLQQSGRKWIATNDSCQAISPYLFCSFQNTGCYEGTSCRMEGLCSGDPAHYAISCFGCVDPLDPTQANQCQ